MKKLYLILFFFLYNALLYAQIYEIGVFGGGTNVIGDVGSTTFVAPQKLAIGGLFRWNRSPRHSFRASVIYTSMYADDRRSTDPRREQRGFFLMPKS